MTDAEFRRVTDFLAYQFIRDRVLYGTGVKDVEWESEMRQKTGYDETEILKELNRKLKEVEDG